jgi:RNA polymerase sigma-70 factor (ECF subfamily)
MFQAIEDFQYQSEAGFFAWVKRIMINESLMHLRKRKEIQILSINESLDHEPDLTILDELGSAELLKVIKGIPVGYRTVFNLHEIEGYSHHEIASMLGISVGTSRSQLHKAKKQLREILEKEQYGYGS